MSTPKTREQRAKEFTDKHGLDARGSLLQEAYLQGDVDRERIMREEASRDRADLIARCKDELAAKDRRIAFLEKEATRLFEPTKEFWNQENLKEARADRAELVACVLAFFNAADSAVDHAELDRMLIGVQDKHADLITKLKAEKDTP